MKISLFTLHSDSTCNIMLYACWYDILWHFISVCCQGTVSLQFTWALAASLVNEQYSSVSACNFSHSSFGWQRINYPSYCGWGWAVIVWIHVTVRATHNCCQGCVLLVYIHPTITAQNYGWVFLYQQYMVHFDEHSVMVSHSFSSCEWLITLQFPDAAD
jgi:hypothetical protein